MKRTCIGALAIVDRRLLVLTGAARGIDVRIRIERTDRRAVDRVRQTDRKIDIRLRNSPMSRCDQSHVALRPVPCRAATSPMSCRSPAQ